MGVLRARRAKRAKCGGGAIRALRRGASIDKREQVANAILTLFPTAERLLKAPDVELDRALLRRVTEICDDPIRRMATRESISLELFDRGGYEGDVRKRNEVERAIGRAWRRLEGSELIEEPDLDNGRNGYRIVSNKGRAASESNLRTVTADASIGVSAIGTVDRSSEGPIGHVLRLGTGRFVISSEPRGGQDGGLWPLGGGSLEPDSMTPPPPPPAPGEMTPAAREQAPAAFDASAFDSSAFQAGPLQQGAAEPIGPPPTLSPDPDAWGAHHPSATDAAAHDTIPFSGAGGMLAAATIAPGTRPRRMRTAVGRSVQRNRVTIVLQVAALLPLVDQRLAALRDERPNAVEAEAERNDAIVRYESLKRQLESVRDKMLVVEDESVDERTVEKSAKSFGLFVQDWWEKKHVEICSKAYDAGLFASCVAVCCLAGAGGPLAVAVSGALVGGKPVVDALKHVAKTFRRPPGATNDPG
jgi:hypothetical protein